MSSDDFAVDISTSRSRLDLPRVHRWLSTDTSWAMGRSLSTVQSSFDASISFGAFTADGGQVGCARVVTDRATFAWLCDVYVDRSFRGQGIGSLLARAVVDELTPMGLTRVLLSTVDAHDVYARVGFEPLPEPSKFMILRPPAASRPH